MRTSWTFWLLHAILIGSTSAANIPVDKMDMPVTSLDIYEEPWEGSRAIVARDGAATWLGTAATFWGGVIAATCIPDGPLTTPAGCGVTLAVGILGAVFSLIAAIVSAASGSSSAGQMHDQNGYYSWEYASLPDGPSMLEQVQGAFTQADDGLPVRLGNTSCNREGQVCHSLWYSQKTLGNKKLHHVQLTPHYFDFRFPPSRTGSSIRARQTEETTGSVSTSGGELYGGFAFNEAAPATLSGLYALGQSTFVNDIATSMASDWSNSGTYGHSGAYCMDFSTVSGLSQSGAGTEGYYWVGNSPNGFPSGGESGLYNQCVSQADYNG